MLTVTLDMACCIDVYRQTGVPDGCLLSLLKQGLLNKVDVAVSDVALEDLEKAAPGQRPLYERRLGLFPMVKASDDEIAARDSLADQILAGLFPGSPKDSSSHDNNRRDCRHLATHRLRQRDLFVTLDRRLLAKAQVAKENFGIVLVDPEKALGQLQLEAPSFLPLGVAIRPYRADDQAFVHKTLFSSGKDWLIEHLRGPQAELVIGDLEGSPAALAFWEHREQGEVEIYAFNVAPEASATDLAGHLLFSLLRNWIGRGYDTARIVLDEDDPFVSLFLDQGFMVSGMRKRPSSPSKVQLDLVKYFLRLRLVQEQYPDFLVKLVALLSPASERVSKGMQFLRPLDQESIAATFHEESGSITISRGRSGDRTLTPAELEIAFYPLRVLLTVRRALIVPIEPQWAERMMPFVGRQESLFRSQDPLLIRSDNVYYCYPKCRRDVSARSSIIFYVSFPVSACVGEAKILQWSIDSPEILHALFGGIGVYDLPQVASHIQRSGWNAGRALALRFSHYVAFPNPVALGELRHILAKPRMTPQALHPISAKEFETIRTKGGAEW